MNWDGANQEMGHEHQLHQMMMFKIDEPAIEVVNQDSFLNNCHNINKGQADVINDSSQ